MLREPRHQTVTQLFRQDLSVHVPAEVEEAEKTQVVVKVSQVQVGWAGARPKYDTRVEIKTADKENVVSGAQAEYILALCLLARKTRARGVLQSIYDTVVSFLNAG